METGEKATGRKAVIEHTGCFRAPRCSLSLHRKKIDEEYPDGKQNIHETNHQSAWMAAEGLRKTSRPCYRAAGL
jgi:hypothetical protein